MRILAFLIFIMPLQVLAQPAECPVQPTKEICLASVEENYQNALDFLRNEEEDRRDRLILAAQEVKTFEAKACHKTCSSLQMEASLKATLRSGDKV